MRPWPTPIVLATLTVTLIASCGARTTLDAEAPPTTSACAACEVSECANFYVQCEEGSSCYAIEQCVLSGTTTETCVCENVPGADAYLALEECILLSACSDGACSAACAGVDAEAGCDDPFEPLMCPGTPIETGGGINVACNPCVAESCGDFASACDSGSDCRSYVACLAACSTSACAEACSSEHSAGEAAAEALDVCLGGACQAACSF